MTINPTELLAEDTLYQITVPVGLYVQLHNTVLERLTLELLSMTHQAAGVQL